MEQTATTIEQKLFRVLSQFHRFVWHQQPIEGCKPSDIRVLFCIKKGISSERPTMKVSEISKQLQVTSPTISQLLNGLEANGLIERHVDPLDRRSVGVRLTKKGEMVTQQAASAFLASMRGLIDYLGEEESDQLAELLLKALRYFDERKAHMYHTRWNGDEEV